VCSSDLRALEDQVDASQEVQAQETYDDYEAVVSVDEVENYDSEHQWEDMAEAVTDDDHSLASMAATLAHDKPAIEMPGIGQGPEGGENRSMTRKTARLKRQNQAAIKTLIIVGVLTPILLVVGFYLLRGGDDGNNQPAKDSVVKDDTNKDNTGTEEFFSDIQREKKKTLDKVWTRVKTIRPTGAIKTLYDTAKAKVKESDELWAAHQFAQWEQKHPEFDKAVGALEAWLLDRDEALRAREAAQIALEILQRSNGDAPEEDDSEGAE